jgi:HAD superfamily hydrolase (TIGR01509 family)
MGSRTNSVTDVTRPSWLQAVLFDLDGTLIDTETQTRAAVTDLLHRAGYAVTPEQVRNIAGRTMPDWLRDELRIPRQEAGALYDAYRQGAAMAIAASAKPLPHSQALIDALVAVDVGIAIVTTRLMESVEIALKSVGWSNRFQTVVAQQSAPRPKPAPDPALFALEALGVLPANAVMIGDSEADMTCASKARLNMVIGLDVTRPAAALRDAGATHVCNDLDEVRTLLLGRDGDSGSATSPG